MLGYMKDEEKTKEERDTRMGPCRSVSYVPYCIVSYRIVSHRTVPHRTILRRILSYPIASHRIVSYRTASYRIRPALPWSTQLGLDLAGWVRAGSVQTVVCTFVLKGCRWV